MLLFCKFNNLFTRRQFVEGVRRRLGAAGAGRHRDAADVHVAARQPAAVRKNAQAGIPARRPDRDAGKAPAATGRGHRGVFDQRSPERTDRADAQFEALQGAAREERDSHHRDRADATDRRSERIRMEELSGPSPR